MTLLLIPGINNTARTFAPMIAAMPETIDCTAVDCPALPDLDAIAFRSRTTPERSFNLAFFSSDAFAADARPLVDCPDELADLVLHHHLTVDFDL